MTATRLIDGRVAGEAAFYIVSSNEDRIFRAAQQVAATHLRAAGNYYIVTTVRGD